MDNGADSRSIRRHVALKHRYQKAITGTRLDDGAQVTQLSVQEPARRTRCERAATAGELKARR